MLGVDIVCNVHKGRPENAFAKYPIELFIGALHPLLLLLFPNDALSLFSVCCYVFLHEELSNSLDWLFIVAPVVINDLPPFLNDAHLLGK